jgi:trehalose-6-phosphate synthase
MALDRALKMPLEERQLRMFQLKKRERRMDVDAWVKSFLFEMDYIHGVGQPCMYHLIHFYC